MVSRHPTRGEFTLVTSQKEDLLSAVWKGYKSFCEGMAERMAYPGLLTENEICSECLLVIDKLLRRYPHVDPYAKTFEKMLRRSVIYRIRNVESSIRARREEPLFGLHDTSGPDDGDCKGTSDCLGWGFVPGFPFPHHPHESDPVESACFDEFCEVVYDELACNVESQRLWEMMAIHPWEFESARKLYYSTRGGVRQKICIVGIIGSYLGWTRGKAWRRLHTVRDAIRKVASGRTDVNVVHRPSSKNVQNLREKTGLRSV